MSVPHPSPAARILWLDAALCLFTGLVLAVANAPIAAITAIPAGLVQWAGLLLLPVAAFMAFVASRRPVPAFGLILIVIGNLGWIVASLALLTGFWFAPNAIGVTFILAQAALVALFAWIEHAAIRSEPAGA